jgi:hypothetical protein
MPRFIVMYSLIVTLPRCDDSCYANQQKRHPDCHFSHFCRKVRASWRSTVFDADWFPVE